MLINLQTHQRSRSIYISRLAVDLDSTLLKSLVKFTKVEGEYGKPIKLIIYAFKNISTEIRGLRRPENSQDDSASRQKRGVLYARHGSRRVHRFRCVTIKAVGGSCDQINDVINLIKYHRGYQQCGRIPRGIGSEANVGTPNRSTFISSLSPAVSWFLSLLLGTPSLPYYMISFFFFD